MKIETALRGTEFSDHIEDVIAGAPRRFRLREWAVLAIIRVLDAEGYVIVPKEATEEMVAEVDRNIRELPVRERLVTGVGRLKTLATIHRLMIEARPSEYM